ncbi:MAG TPA: hypothetical protein VGI22_27945 [Xanthobacteraceae bacterium]|jgi:hypothetical protein
MSHALAVAPDHQTLAGPVGGFFGTVQITDHFFLGVDWVCAAELRNVEILAIIGIVHSRVGRVAGFR